MVGSLICALAQNLGMLLAGRAIQCVGAGGLSVLTNVIISDMFSLRERGFYLSLIGLTWAFATAIGPLIGGGFAQNVSWRWCFWINLPCDGLAFALLFFFLKVDNPRTPLLAGLKAVDWLGSLTITAATVLFLSGVQFGGVVFPWDSATVICLIIFGLLTYVLFFVVEWRLSSLLASSPTDPPLQSWRSPSPTASPTSQGPTTSRSTSRQSLAPRPSLVESGSSPARAP